MQLYFSVKEQNTDKNKKTQSKDITSSLISTALKTILGIIWLPIGFLIFLFASYVEYSSGNFLIFYAQTFISFLIILIIALSPYLLMFKKYFWIIIAILVGLSVLNLLTSKVSHFFPPIPVYNGATNIQYENSHSGTGELASNNIIMKFKIPNGSDLQVMKKVILYYQDVFTKRGYMITTRGNSQYDCISNINQYISTNKNLDGFTCSIVSTKDTFSHFGFYIYRDYIFFSD